MLGKKKKKAKLTKMTGKMKTNQKRKETLHVTVKDDRRKREYIGTKHGKIVRE